MILKVCPLYSYDSIINKLMFLIVIAFNEGISFLFSTLIHELSCHTGHREGHTKYKFNFELTLILHYVHFE